jgi:hypothetical protein
MQHSVGAHLGTVKLVARDIPQTPAIGAGLDMYDTIPIEI